MFPLTMNRGAKKCSMVAVRSARSPSPQPSPLGRGRHAGPALWLDWVRPQFRDSMCEVWLGRPFWFATIILIVWPVRPGLSLWLLRRGALFLLATVMPSGLRQEYRRFARASRGTFDAL